MICVARVPPHPGNLHSVALEIREMTKAINRINESVKRLQTGPRTVQKLPKRPRLRLLSPKVAR
jgi:hypothetical protein